jgi:hypothetical protein
MLQQKLAREPNQAKLDERLGFARTPQVWGVRDKN